MRTLGRFLSLRPRAGVVRGAMVALAGWLALAAWAQTVLPLGVLSWSDDPRYAPRRLERAYPEQPAGRIDAAVQMALDDAALALQDAKLRVAVNEQTMASLADLPRVLTDWKKAGVHHIVADLPADWLTALTAQAPAALGGALIINVSSDDDALRNARCAPTLLHTLPSRAMLTDALAQYLAAREWRKVLLLQGDSAADQQLGQAVQRSARKYGLKIVQTKRFKLSGDPRERDLFNPRLLTNDREHDVVWVADADGEFARSLPYATQWPRPVVGANGLMAMAWHPHWERNGGPQVARRFAKHAQRPMRSHDWAAWMAVKTVVALGLERPKATVAQQVAALRAAEVFVDGAKGPRLSYRAWDGQLRQPILLAHGDGVVGKAPLDGVLHPNDVLDTLGTDEQESQCKTKP